MKKFYDGERLSMYENKYVTVEHHTVDFGFPLHWHSFLEIEIVTEGEGYTTINGTDYDVSQYNVYLISATDFHSFKVSRHTEIINISFNRNLVSDADLSKLFFAKNEKGYKFSEDELRRIVYASELLEHECLINGDAVGQLLSYILNCIFRKRGELAPSEQIGQHANAIRDSLLYIEEHFREDISLEEVSRRVGYSTSYFSRIFKIATGQSYVDTITDLRLSNARTLLSNGYSVSESCFSSGFGSISGFFVAFKKKFGVAPSKYTEK